MRNILVSGFGVCSKFDGKWWNNLPEYPYQSLNTLRPRQDGRRFPDDTFERIFLKENVIILIKISLKFVPNGPIDNITALVQIMAWRRPGDKPLSEPMMVRLPTHICVTGPQWVKTHCDYRWQPLELWRMRNRNSHVIEEAKTIIQYIILGLCSLFLHGRYSNYVHHPEYAEACKTTVIEHYDKGPLLLIWFNFNPRMNK